MPASSRPEDLAAKARFVFQGTVKKLNAATLEEVKDTSRTAVVLVDETIQAPKPLSHYSGKEITVQFAEPADVKVGERAIFFADAWLFGNASVAVRSLGHQPTGPAVAAVLGPRGDPVMNLEDREAQAHYNAADMVASGRVVTVRLPEDVPKIPAPREHDPDWREAVVQIDQVHKGDKTKKEVVVRFPQSYDRMWAKAPKFQVGQQGHFLLHRPTGAASTPVLAAQIAAGDYYTVLHSEDFETEDRRGRIERLLAKLSGVATAKA